MDQWRRRYMLSPPRTCPAFGGSGRIQFPCCKLPPPGGDCLLPLASGCEALLLHGCDEGWHKLDREVDKKIVDGQRLVSILHSSHEGHDDSLHKGECIYILFTRLLMLGQGCLCCACTLAPVLIIVGAAPGDKGEEAVLPEEGVCIEL